MIITNDSPSLNKYYEYCIKTVPIITDVDEYNEIVANNSIKSSLEKLC